MFSMRPTCSAIAFVASLSILLNTGTTCCGQGTTGNLVRNGSFEDWSHFDSPGWTGNRVLRLGWPEAFEGTNYVALGGLSQQLNTTPGVTYRLDFKAAPNLYFKGETTFTVGLNLDNRSFTTQSHPPTPGNPFGPIYWEGFSALFTASTTLTTLNFEPVDNEFFLDLVEVSAVPEPSILALWAVGILLAVKTQRNSQNGRSCARAS